jgi:hypothetical protein
MLNLVSSLMVLVCCCVLGCRAYRARAVRDPRGLLAEFGTVLPDNTAIRVHDSTADLRWGAGQQL